MLLQKNNGSVFRTMQATVFTVVLLLFLFRLFNKVLFSQIGDMPFLFEEKEVVYRLFFKSGIPQFILSHHLVAAICDACLFAFPTAVLISGKRIFAILTSLICAIYFLTFNIVTGHHYHGLVGVLVIVIPFWWEDQKKFSLAWQGARYYLLYIFASAALWKILRGSVFYEEQLSNILKQQQLSLLFWDEGETLHGIFIKYLIANHKISHVVLVANVFVQLSFIIGFFTKRFDRVLIFLVFLFVLANYVVMGILSAELLILILTLLEWDKISNTIQKLKLRSS
jgi:hypothetical protein